VASRLILRSARGEHAVVAGPDGRVEIDGATMEVAWDDPRLARVDGERVWVVVAGATRWVYHNGCVHVLEAGNEDAPRRSRVHSGSLSAPMPATVRQIRVNAGDTVQRGDTLVVLEAMKMELPIRAAGNGTISAVRCREGELVQPGVPLVDFVAEGA
jgi:3-methylcrotonyl-CoA carboxylase alpha subunit